MEISNLYSFGLVFVCGSLHLLPLAAGGSLSDGDWARCQSMSRVDVLRNHFIALLLLLFCCFCFRLVMSNSILGLWANQFLVSGHPGSVELGFSLLVWTSN